MKENASPEEEPASKPGPRTITVTLPSGRAVLAAVLGGVCLLALILGGVSGYRHLSHRQHLEAARNEMAVFFKERQVKASAMLQVAGNDAVALQKDLSAALLASQSASIPSVDLATRQQGLVQDLAGVQKIFSSLGDEEQHLVQQKELSPADTLFSAENQKQFTTLQEQWQSLNDQQTQLATLLQDAVVRKDSLLAIEQKAVALAAARKVAEAKAQSRARAQAREVQSQQASSPAVFGAPNYYNYSGRYYTAPIYGPNYYPRYGGAYGYGWGW